MCFLPCLSKLEALEKWSPQTEQGNGFSPACRDRCTSPTLRCRCSPIVNSRIYKCLRREYLSCNRYGTLIIMQLSLYGYIGIFQETHSGKGSKTAMFRSRIHMNSHWFDSHRPGSRSQEIGKKFYLYAPQVLTLHFKYFVLTRLR